MDFLQCIIMYKQIQKVNTIVLTFCMLFYEGQMYLCTFSVELVPNKTTGCRTTARHYTS